MASTKFGDWVVINKLTSDTGQATTFLVYREEDKPELPRVLKCMKGNGGPFLNRDSRIKSEIEACKQLKHNNIVKLIDSGEHKGKPFIVTEYCEGGSLNPRSLVGKTFLERLTLFRDICKGVAYAHSQGIVHRDLKPDNIFLQKNGNPVVGDFGLCYFLDRVQERVTHADEAVGARWYMAPECAGGITPDVGKTADVYSLGKVLYWMLAGRIFDREQYSQRRYDLRLNQTTTDMSVVYELFEQTILEDPAARLKDGEFLVREVDSVLQRIQSRQRTYDLANAPLCTANHTEVRVAKFRDGSLVNYDLVGTDEFQIMGFGGRDNKLALWGVRPPGQSPTELAVITHDGMDSWSISKLKTNGSFAMIQSSGFESLCFNKNRQACVAVTEVQQDGQTGKLLLVIDVGQSELSTNLIAEDVGKPRNSALSFSPFDELAIYSGSDDSVMSHTHPETIIQANSKLDRFTIKPHSNFPAPLAYDLNGKLHQAIVASVPDNGKEVRELIYISKEPSKEWSQVIIDSTSGNGELKPTLGNRMSGHISLNLKPDGFPVIIANSSRLSDEHLVVYFIEAGTWKNHEIDLRSISKEFGLSSIDLGGRKQLLFDTYLEDKVNKTRAHISIFTNSGGSSGVLYLALDEKWNVIDQRYLPAKKVYGMAIDYAGTVHIAIK